MFHVGKKLTVIVQGDVERSNSGSCFYNSTVFPDITCGEFIRNSCVNLGIDPDTHDGVTRNVRVYILKDDEELLWNYDPSSSLEESPLVDALKLRIVEISFKNLKT